MTGQTIAAFAVSAAAFAALALVAWQLWRGRWLALIAGRAGAAAEGEKGDGVRKAARRMALVALIECALVATLIVYEAARMQGPGAAGTVWALAMVNNAAFLAFVGVMIWFFIVQRPSKDERRGRASAPDAARGTEGAENAESGAEHAAAARDAAAAASAAERRAQVARLDHMPLATILFTLALIAIAAAVGILFA